MSIESTHRKSTEVHCKIRITEQLTKGNVTKNDDEDVTVYNYNMHIVLVLFTGLIFHE